MQDLKQEHLLEQQVIFTEWVNNLLATVNESVADLQTDLRDGRLFAKLVEVLTKTEMPALQEGSLRVHEIARVNACLHFLAASFPQLEIYDIGAEDVVDGNLKMILGLVYKLQLLQIIIVGKSIVKSHTTCTDMDGDGDLLLQWCKSVLAPYHNVAIHSFHQGFENGLALCALIHAYDPMVIGSYTQLAPDCADANLRLVSDVAKNYLGVQCILDPKDVRPFVAQLHSKLTGTFKKTHAASHLARAYKIVEDVETMKLALNNSIRFSKMHAAEMKQMYPEDAENILECVLSVGQELVQFDLDDSAVEIRWKFQRLNKTKLIIAKDPEWSASLLAQLDDCLVEMDACEEVMAKANSYAAQHLEVLALCETMAETVYRTARHHKKMQAAAERALSWQRVSPSLNHTVADIEAEISRVTALQKNIQENELNAGAAYDVLTNLRHLGCGKEKLHRIERLVQGQLTASYDTLNEKLSNRIRELNEALASTKQTETAMRNWAEGAHALYGNLARMQQDLIPATHTTSVQDAVSRQDYYQEMKRRDLTLYGQKIEALRRSQASLASMVGGDQPNPFTWLTLSQLETQYADVAKTIRKRLLWLESNIKVKKRVEECFLEFSSLAGSITARLDVMENLANNIGTISDLDSTDLLLAERLLGELVRGKVMDDLQLASEIREELIGFNTLINPHTTTSIADLWRHYCKVKAMVAVPVAAAHATLRGQKVMTDKSRDFLRGVFDQYVASGRDAITQSDTTKCLQIGAFTLSGKVRQEDDADILAALAQYQHQAELSFSDYVNAMLTLLPSGYTNTDIMTCFEILADGQNYIESQDLMQTNSDKTIKRLCANLKPSGDTDAPSTALSYRNFVHKYFRNGSPVKTCDL